MLDKFLSFNFDNYADNKEFDMDESIKKTLDTTKKFPDLYGSLVSYISGNCYYNGKLSHQHELSDKEVGETKNLNDLISKTEPISKPLHLFHGFEVGIKYDDHKWKIGNKIIFNFHLSKTPAYWVASRFGDHFSWYIHKIKSGLFTSIPACYNIGYIAAIKTIFFQKYLFCIYKEINKWKHVSTDIRCPNDLLVIANTNARKILLMNEEFEYLSHTKEIFILADIVYKFSLVPPFVRKFYIMERTDADADDLKFVRKF